jgi:hypothetical protein
MAGSKAPQYFGMNQRKAKRLECVRARSGRFVQIREALNFTTASPSVGSRRARLGDEPDEKDANMLRPQSTAPGGARSASPFFVNDLCAQLAPLNRYGPTGLGAAVVSAVRALTGVSRAALCAASGCDRH